MIKQVLKYLIEKVSRFLYKAFLRAFHMLMCLMNLCD